MNSQNTRTKSKLLTLTLFLVIIIAIAAAVLFMLLQSLTHYKNDTNASYRGIYYVTQIDKGIKSLQSEYSAVADSTAQRSASITKINSVKSELDSNIKSLETIGLIDTDLNLLESLKAAYYDTLIPLGSSLLESGSKLDLAGVFDAGDSALSISSELYTSILAKSAPSDNSIYINLLIFAGVLAALIVLILILSQAFGKYIENTITSPAGKLAFAANAIAVGDVEVTLDINSDDEMGSLADALGKIVDSCNEQARVLAHISRGDYTANIKPRSKKDIINREILQILDYNNDMLIDIKSASEQVLIGSNAIAQDSRQLALGASNQADSIKQLSEASQAILEQSEISASIATDALNNTLRESELMTESMVSMKAMTDAMNEINSSSKSISKVIKVIEDIAFQTNILALNASIEAARAGSQGKGFAVVAEEVRNLANKSSAAAKETAALIENSIRKVTEGNAIAAGTNNSLTRAGEIVSENAESMNKISDYSQKQRAAIFDITRGISQISSVIEQNTESSEQSAASLQQITAQAQRLNTSLSQYKIAEYTDKKRLLPRKGEPVKYLTGASKKRP